MIKIKILILIFCVQNAYAGVTFENIKGRQIASFELTDIITALSAEDKLENLERWVEMSPGSFKGLNFTKSYIDAGDKMLAQGSTNDAVRAYIKAYQVIDRNHELKITAAYKASFLLYAQHNRNEALFYINRAVENLIRQGNHELVKDIFYLKRRIVWRYFSRLDSLPDNAISAVEFDGDDVWIGMWSGGLGRFSRSQSQLDLFNVRNTELPSNYVRDILVKDDKVWVATHDGLAYYQKSDASWHKVDSMQNYKFKTISCDGGYFYTSTLFNGVFKSADGITWENIIPKQNVLDIFKSGDNIYIATPSSVLIYKDGAVSGFLPGVSAKTHRTFSPAEKGYPIRHLGSRTCRVLCK